MVSPLSNVVTPVCTSPLPPIQDLAAVAVHATGVDLTWTAVGNECSGQADSYDLRYSTSPITPSNFVAATPVGGVAAPQEGGASEQFTVHGLSPRTTYYFAIEAETEAGNNSGPSNVATVTTPAVVGDVNGDDHVNVLDLLIFAESWGKASGQAGYNAACDFDHGGSVDVVDLLLLAEHWGE